MLICFIPGEINPDLLVKVMSAGCFYCKVTLFPFAINKYLGVG